MIKSLNLKDAKVYLLQDGDHTPFIFADIAATRKNDDRTILFYSHFDKMPATTGWDEGKGATKPVIENGRLYGRGTADDGYASFSVFTAVKCCQDHGVPLPRICITIEGCEESILKEFIDEIFDDIQDIPPEIMEIVDEYFFEIL